MSELSELRDDQFWWELAIADLKCAEDWLIQASENFEMALKGVGELRKILCEESVNEE